MELLAPISLALMSPCRCLERITRTFERKWRRCSSSGEWRSAGGDKGGERRRGEKRGEKERGGDGWGGTPLLL